MDPCCYVSTTTFADYIYIYMIGVYLSLYSIGSLVLSTYKYEDEDKCKGSVSPNEFEVQKRLLDICYGDPNKVKKPGKHLT